MNTKYKSSPKRKNININSFNGKKIIIKDKKQNLEFIIKSLNLDKNNKIERSSQSYRKAYNKKLEFSKIKQANKLKNQIDEKENEIEINNKENELKNEEDEKNKYLLKEIQFLNEKKVNNKNEYKEKELENQKVIKILNEKLTNFEKENIELKGKTKQFELLNEKLKNIEKENKELKGKTEQFELLKEKISEIEKKNKELKEKQGQIVLSKKEDIKKAHDIIKSLQLKLAEIEKENEELKENQKKISLPKKEVQDEFEEKYNINITNKFNKKLKLKYSNNPKKPFELERNKSMDIKQFKYPQKEFIFKNHNNSLNSENNFEKRLIGNLEEEQYLINKEQNKMKEDYKRKSISIFNLNDRQKFFENENNEKKSYQKKKNIFDLNKTTRNSLEINWHDKKNYSERKGFNFSDTSKNRDEKAVKINNYKGLNTSREDKKNIKLMIEDIKDDGKIRNENGKTKLLSSIKNTDFENNNKENDKNIKLNEENKNLKDQLKLNEEEIVRLKKENDDLILKIKELNEENEKLNKKLENNIENIKKEKLELYDSINDLKIRNEELQKEKEKNEEIIKLKLELNDKINDLKIRNEELQKEKEKNKEIINLKIENQRLNEKIKEEIQKYNSLNNKNIELNKENDNIKLVLNKDMDEKNSLIKEKDKLNEENKNLILQFDREKNKIISKEKDLKRQLNDLKLSFEQNKIQQNELLMDIMNNNPMIIYSKPTSIGLNNIGATCFMNSTLQCLSQTKELASYFLKPKNKNEIINNNIALENMNSNQLCPAFLELIQKLWDRNGQKSFSPNKFMNIVNEINSLFKAGQAGDAKDFIIFVLEQLHKELKKPINPNNNLGFETLNQYDKNSALNYFFKDFKNDLSIISDIFYGFNETTNECLNCKNIYNFKGLSNNPICYNYGIFNCLIFPLEEVKNFKFNNNCQFNNYFQINNCVSIYDCFQYNQKTELFTGQNRNYCNQCKQLFDSYYTSKIYICPTVLIIILNRGKGNIYNIKLFFDEILDVTEFVLQKEGSKIVYNLYGVITHIGQSGPNAHFVASCKSPIDNKWYRYNDSFVNPIENVQKEIIDFGTPYILFYHK